MQYFKFICIGLALIVTIVFRQSSTDTAPVKTVTEEEQAVLSDETTEEIQVMEPVAETEKGLILEVLDGQTVKVLFSDKREEVIALANIRTPSFSQNEPYSTEAKAALQKVLYRDSVAEFEFSSPHRNEEGNRVAFVWRKDVFVNAYLLEQGLAEGVFDNETAYEVLLQEAEQIARDKQYYIWSQQ